MLSYPATIPLSSRTLNHHAELVGSYRRRRRSRWRPLNPGRQALLALAHLQRRHLPLLREAVRRQLETGAPARASITVPNWWSSSIEHSLTEIASNMRAGLGTADGQELLLGFPPAPFVLTLAAQPPYTMQHFLTFARHRQRHAVGLRRQRVDAHVTQWEVFAKEHPDAYRLSFTVPDRVEEWIGQSESTRKRTLAIKESLLATIVLYRLRQGHVTVYQLEYQPEELSTPNRPAAT